MLRCIRRYSSSSTGSAANPLAVACDVGDLIIVEDEARRRYLLGEGAFEVVAEPVLGGIDITSDSGRALMAERLRDRLDAAGRGREQVMTRENMAALVRPKE
jgi:hypothetical protein